MKVWLERQGKQASWKWVQRLMWVVGLWAIYRQSRTSQPALGVRVNPFLLEKAKVTQANQMWAEDITCLPMARVFFY